MTNDPEEDAKLIALLATGAVLAHVCFAVLLATIPPAEGQPPLSLTNAFLEAGAVVWGLVGVVIVAGVVFHVTYRLAYYVTSGHFADEIGRWRRDE